MGKTKNEWTYDTWNPSTGCSKISAGCANCYAEKMSFRLQCMGNPKYKDGFKLTTHIKSLNEPYNWKSPKKVFVNSMSDIFHEDIPFSFIEKVFKVMNDNPRHIFQVLTKRSEILKEYSNHLTWSKNIWMGVSIEDENQLFRIYSLQGTPAKVKFLSCEPLLSDLGKMDLKGIHWVIVGGESGTNSRTMEEVWVQNILKQCRKQKVPFFFKQWGGFNKKKNGRVLNGKTYSEMPVVI
jgi:protein gp37